MGALLLDVGLGDNLGGEVEPLAEVVEALGGEAVRNGVSMWLDSERSRACRVFDWTGPRKVVGDQNVRVVVPLPGELGLEVTARGQGLAGLDDIEVLGVNVAVLGLVEVLLCDENTLCGESVWLCGVWAIQDWVEDVGGYEPRKRYS